MPEKILGVHPAGAGTQATTSSVTADAVVVGGGTIGAWCAYFLRRAGLGKVVLLEAETLGYGASSRAAGLVRSQGGTPWTVQLGEWSRRFYLSQRDEIGTDSGFVRQGYVLPCSSEAEVTAAKERMAMQNAQGIGVRWLDEAELLEVNPNLAKGQTLGATYYAEDGFITPQRNVTAYTVALAASGVEIREHVAFLGLSTASGRVAAVRTTAGPIASPLVILTGGPRLAHVGRLAGVKIPVGGARHHVALTGPHPDFEPSRTTMVFHLGTGLYWRPEEGGLLFGFSNPGEPPGEATSVDESYLAAMRDSLGQLVPVTATLGLRKIWAATIDYTTDHLPIIGPALTSSGELPGVVVASAGGHGMMWGPAVARAAADLALTGQSDVVDLTSLGLDRFDAAGVSKLATDPIALPFPTAVGDAT